VKGGGGGCLKVCMLGAAGAHCGRLGVQLSPVCGVTRRTDCTSCGSAAQRGVARPPSPPCLAAGWRPAAGGELHGPRPAGRLPGDEPHRRQAAAVPGGGAVPGHRAHQGAGQPRPVRHRPRVLAAHPRRPLLQALLGRGVAVGGGVGLAWVGSLGGAAGQRPEEVPGAP
jgi:hypothetical protein